MAKQYAEPAFYEEKLEKVMARLGTREYIKEGINREPSTF